MRVSADMANAGPFSPARDLQARLDAALGPQSAERNDTASDLAEPTAAEFEAIAAHLARAAGIRLEAHKKQLVLTRLSPRLRDLGMSSFAAYCALLESPDGGDEIPFMVNRLTTNLTKFFREPHHFEDLARRLEQRLAVQPRARLRIWSAGCSTGQEPYSIAMVLAAATRRAGPGDRLVLATDIDSEVLARAEAALYAEADRRAAPPAMRGYFGAPDAQGRCRIAPEVAKLVRFKPLNLLEDWPMRGRFEAIFFRNVAIYFPIDVQQQLYGQMAHLLAPGGVLYLGHSESIRGARLGLETLGQTMFRKPATGGDDCWSGS